MNNVFLYFYENFESYKNYVLRKKVLIESKILKPGYDIPCICSEILNFQHFVSRDDNLFELIASLLCCLNHLSKKFFSKKSFSKDIVRYIDKLHTRSMKYMRNNGTYKIYDFIDLKLKASPVYSCQEYLDENDGCKFYKKRYEFLHRTKMLSDTKNTVLNSKLIYFKDGKIVATANPTMIGYMSFLPKSQVRWEWNVIDGRMIYNSAFFSTVELKIFTHHETFIYDYAHLIQLLEKYLIMLNYDTYAEMVDNIDERTLVAGREFQMRDLGKVDKETKTIMKLLPHDEVEYIIRPGCRVCQYNSCFSPKRDLPKRDLPMCGLPKRDLPKRDLPTANYSRPKLYKCLVCKWAKYCSIKCQTHDWHIHRNVCKSADVID